MTGNIIRFLFLANTALFCAIWASLLIQGWDGGGLSAKLLALFVLGPALALAIYVFRTYDKWFPGSLIERVIVPLVVAGFVAIFLFELVVLVDLWLARG